MLNELAVECYKNSLDHGFYDDNRDLNGLMNPETVNNAEKIALMHEELSEALAELRSGMRPDFLYYKDVLDGPSPLYAQNGLIKPEGVPAELADVIIRILDFCGLHGIDIDKAIKFKMQYNAGRPYKHGRKF